ncbi:unnamed protein product, partial [Allacma fusca]
KRRCTITSAAIMKGRIKCKEKNRVRVKHILQMP